MNPSHSKPSMEHIETYSDTSEDAAHQGQLLIEDERQLSEWETAKKHWRPLLISSVAFTAGMFFGFDTIVNGASIAMPSFVLHFGEIGPTGPYLPSLWTSLWTSMSALLQAIGALTVGFIADRFGRKWTAVAAGILSIAGTAIQYYADSRGTLTAGKMVTGFCIGSVITMGTTYASETAPLKLIAPIQTALVLFTVLMQGVALGIIRVLVPNIQPQAFRDVFAIQWAVGGLVVLAFAFVPESPVFLINSGRLEAAQKSLIAIYGFSRSTEQRFAYLVKTIKDEASNRELHSGSYLDCFRRQNLKRTLTVMFLYSTANCGGAAFLSQSIYFLTTAGLEAIHGFDVSIGGFGLAILIILAGTLYLKRISRRTTVLTGCILNLLFMTVIGALYYAPGKGPLWGIAVMMNVLISIQTSLMQAAGWPVAAQISSYRLRAKTLSVGLFAQTFSTWLFTFTVPYMYNVDSGNLGARTAFIFAGMSVLLIIGTWYLVPDIAGLSTEDIDELYDQKVPIRNFQSKSRRTSHPVEGQIDSTKA